MYRMCIDIPSVLRVAVSVSLDSFVFLVKSECSQMRVRKMAAAVELPVDSRSKTNFRELTNALTTPVLNTAARGLIFLVEEQL